MSVAGSAHPGGSAGSACAQQVAQVERRGEHGDSATVARARPALRRPVPELDAVALGVGEIERLGDTVVRSSVQAQACLGDPPQRVGETRVG